MKGMILAAGLGTRLKPFTEAHPKALWTVGGKTLLQQALEHLASAGIRDIIINVHHFADQIIEYLYLNQNFGLNLTLSDETGELLETGGGVKKAGWFFEDADAAVVRNTDVLSDLDLVKMAGHHISRESLATLAVRERETSRYFLFDREMHLSGWCNLKTGEKVITRPCENPRMLAFSGIQILSPHFFPLITESGSFSLTGLYLRLSASHDLAGFVDDGTIWQDAGKVTG